MNPTKGGVIKLPTPHEIKGKQESFPVMSTLTTKKAIIWKVVNNVKTRTIVAQH